jgi:hypothetical protein
MQAEPAQRLASTCSKLLDSWQPAMPLFENLICWRPVQLASQGCSPVLLSSTDLCCVHKVMAVHGMGAYACTATQLPATLLA